MEHISEDRLKTDALYRFKYVCKFTGFDEQDIKILHDVAPIVGPLVPVIVDAVYTKLHSFDATWKYFIKRNKGYEGELASNTSDLKLDDSAIQFRKHALTGYLTRLVTAEYDEKFVNYLDYVAKIHTTAGGNSSINVDYVHINALMCYVADILLKSVCELTDVSMETKTQVIRAVNKLLWVQNDMFGKWYTEGQNMLAKKEKYIQIGVASVVAATVGAAIMYFYIK